MVCEGGQYFECVGNFVGWCFQCWEGLVECGVEGGECGGGVGQVVFIYFDCGCDEFIEFQVISFDKIMMQCCIVCCYDVCERCIEGLCLVYVKWVLSELSECWW